MFSSLHRMLPFLGGARNGRNAAANANPDDDDDDDGRQKSVEPEVSDRATSTSSRAGEFLVDEDISRGREHHKLPAVSYKRGDQAPLDFHYVVDQIQWQPVPVDRSLARLACCSCEDDCSDGQCHCASGQRSGRCYDNKGRLHPDYNLEAPAVIYECNAACRCNRKRCKNMVIQNGCKHRLMLFRTKSRGWGIKTLEPLKRGTFVGLYSGELVSAPDSARRADDTYLFNLASTQVYYSSPEDQSVQAVETQACDVASDDSGIGSIMSDGQEGAAEAKDATEAKQEQQQQQFVCDAKFYGNFTRFVNHSCNPNVIGIRSFTSHQDPKFPHIAFFTNQEVPALQELTLNYGDNYWLVKCKRDSCYCLCKQPNCRFNRRNFADTLKQHERQQKGQ